MQKKNILLFRGFRTTVINQQSPVYHVQHTNKQMNEETNYFLVPIYGYHFVPNSLDAPSDPVHLFLQAARYQNPAKSYDTQIRGVALSRQIGTGKTCENTPYQLWFLQ